MAAGCADDPDTATPATVTVTVTATPPTTTSTAAGLASAAIGQPQTTSVGVRATPISFENPTTRQPDPDFTRYDDRPTTWAVLDAELCAGAEPLTKTGYGFTLLDAENREYNSYDNTAQPFEPTIGGSGDLAPGECARGYVNFEQPQGVQIVAIRWDYPGGAGPLRWTL